MNKKIIFSFIVLMFLVSFASAHTGDDDFGHHMTGDMMTGTYGYGFMWAFGWIFMILIIIALILLIIWLIKQIQKK
jgi:hypothetical protein